MKKDKKFKEKIAVFDLDDTLYIGNSHIEILCKYYRTELFKSIFFKIIGKLFPEFERKILNYLYQKIGVSVKENFTLNFNEDVLNILQEKKREGYLILIVSNAPEELLINAAKNLNVEYLSAPPYLKGDVLKQEYSYKYLFVCTDNKSDLDLLLLSDDAVITCKNRHKPFFEKKLKNKKYYFFEG